MVGNNTIMEIIQLYKVTEKQESSRQFTCGATEDYSRTSRENLK